MPLQDPDGPQVVTLVVLISQSGQPFNAYVWILSVAINYLYSNVVEITV